LAGAFSPSVTGTLITVTYYLKVIVKHASMCGGDGKSIIYPIVVLQPAIQMPPQQMVEAPTGWNPVIYSACNFAVPIEMQAQAGLAYQQSVQAQGNVKNDDMTGVIGTNQIAPTTPI
jgi:hypothetical protein